MRASMPAGYVYSFDGRRRRRRRRERFFVCVSRRERTRKRRSSTCASRRRARPAIDRFTRERIVSPNASSSVSIRGARGRLDRIGSDRIGFFGRRKTVDRVCSGDDDVDVELNPRVRRVASRIGREPVARHRFKRRPRPIPHPWCSPIHSRVFASRVVSRGVSIDG